MLDQWRYDWDGMHPNTPTGPLPLQMPFLQHAASIGTRFTQAYVPVPLCAPVRACLAAGKEYDQAGVLGNHADSFPIHQTTFYKLLRNDGNYHTMTCGKDDLFKGDERFPYFVGQHYPATMDLGFSDALRAAGKHKVLKGRKYPDIYRQFLDTTRVTVKEGLESTAFDVYRHCTKQLDQTVCNADSFVQSIHPNDFVQQSALQLLQRHKETASSQPWFLQVNFPGPHAPHMATAAMAESVKDRTWPHPVDNNNNNRGWTCPQQDNPAKDGKTQPAIGGRCNYAAEIEYMDRLMEQVVETVDLDETLVCVTGDHGEMLGDHDWAGKKVPWQGSVSVPLLCFGAGVRAKGKVYDKPVTTLDLVGLFLDTAGVDPTPDMTTTKTLSSILYHDDDDDNRTTQETRRDYVQSGLHDFRLVVKSIHGESYKLICCRGDCPAMPSTTPPREGRPFHQLLYNVHQDPFEMAPLRGKRADEIANELVELLPEGWCRRNDPDGDNDDSVIMTAAASVE